MVTDPQDPNSTPPNQQPPATPPAQASKATPPASAAPTPTPKPEAAAKPAAAAKPTPSAKPAAKKPAAKPKAKKKANPDTPSISLKDVTAGNLETGDASGMILPEGAEVLSPEVWATMDVFSDIQAKAVIKFLERTVKTSTPQHPIWIRRYKAGEVICHQGEQGSTAFFMVSGEVEIYISKSQAAGRRASKRGFFANLFSLKDKRTIRSKQDFIPIDASVDLDAQNPVATLGEGQIFGEQTAMSFTPRGATVRAKTDVVCFEMLRSVLSDLLQRRSKKWKNMLERAYRENALANHLKNVPLFAGLKEEQRDRLVSRLRDEVELVGPFDKGEVICRQGEPSDAFYLIRIGFVKVSQSQPGGEVVIAYLGRGSHFGEMGLLGGIPNTSTCTALDTCELVRVPRKLFLEIFNDPTYFDIRQAMEEDIARRRKEYQGIATTAPKLPLGQFLDQGLMNAQNVLLIDLEKCTRCDECVQACADVHDGVSRFVRDGLRFDKYLVASACRSCSDPVCMIGCPVGSIRREGSLEIRIEDWCIGCGKCANQCPYGNISMHEIPEEAAPGKPFKAETCDLCGDVGGDPNCVYACPHDAAIRVEPKQFFGTNYDGK